MHKLILMFVLLILTALPVNAQTDDFFRDDKHKNECSIWLCLPYGFPDGCSGAYSEMISRLKRRKPPLPELSGCSVGGTPGHYQIGYERYEACEEGFVLREPRNNNDGNSYNNNLKAKCYQASCAPEYVQASNNFRQCPNVDAVERAEPDFVKMWVNGEYLGQFFYSQP